MGDVKKAIRYSLFHERVSVTKRINGFLYFLKKIPWLGKKISPNVYRSDDFKNMLFVVGAIFKIFENILMKGGYIAFFTVLVALFNYAFHLGEVYMGRQEFLLAGVFIWFIMVVLYMNIYNILFLTIDAKTLEFINNFHLPQKFFIKSKMMIDTLLHAIYYIPVAMIVGWLLNSLIIGIAIPFIYLAGAYFGNYLARLVSVKNKIPFLTMSFILIVTAIVALVTGILLSIFTGINWVQTAILSPIGIIVSLILIVIGVQGILTFKRENLYLALVIDRSTSLSVNVNNIATNTTENLQNKMIVTDSHERFGKKKGSSYLNALLFDRYKREFRKIVLIRLVVSVALIIAFSVSHILWVDLAYINLISSLNLIAIPTWISMFSVGRKIVQIVFLNCDNAMLHYPFYRKSEVIISSFYDRLKRTFRLNSVLAIAPIAILAIILVRNQTFDIGIIVTSILILFSTLALFSFHELFLYYMLQPFAEDMQVKSPLYMIITTISSFAIGFVTIILQSILALIFIAFTIIYIGFGLIILTKFAPKTFKARN